MRTGQCQAVHSVAPLIHTYYPQAPIASKISCNGCDTQVNIGVSRKVYLLASVSRSCCTRSRKSLTTSVSNATTNSWSSNPKEYVVFNETDGNVSPTRI